jgi:hypothetical protein
VDDESAHAERGMNRCDQIRAALGSDPMSMDQLAQTYGWTDEERREAVKRMSAMKLRGEVRTRVEDGKAVWELVIGYAPKRAPRGTTEPKAEKKAPSDREMKLPQNKPAAAVVAASTSDNTKYANELLSDVLTAAQGKKPFDLDLLTRLNAISDDINDALTDAVDANHDKTIVKHLLAASRSLLQASRAYPRS